jgi:hypothetical protein
MANQGSDYTRGWDLPSNFEMPTAREIELDLALGSDSWQSLRQATKLPPPIPSGRQAIVVGGGMAGLQAARRVLGPLARALRRAR